MLGDEQLEENTDQPEMALSQSENAVATWELYPPSWLHQVTV